MNSTEIVRSFWDAMRSNDFSVAAHTWLAPDYLGLWPQTGEVIRGPDAYARVNDAFPGHGHWEFEERSLLADGDRVVTDMLIFNEALKVSIHAISFHETAGGLIIRQTEYWPDAYPAPEWRRGLLEIDSTLARW